jgi:hypothetical protein
MSTYGQDTCHVTLVGPAYFGPSSPLIALLPWTQPEWRRIVVELQVGTDTCPDWDFDTPDVDSRAFFNANTLEELHRLEQTT